MEITPINLSGHLGTTQKYTLILSAVSGVAAIALYALGTSHKLQRFFIGTGLLGLAGRLATEPAGRYVNRRLKQILTSNEPKIGEVENLINWGGNLKTAVKVATQNNQIEILKKLLQDNNCLSTYFEMAIFIAYRKGHDQLTRALLQDPRVGATQIEGTISKILDWKSSERLSLGPVKCIRLLKEVMWWAIRCNKPGVVELLVSSTNKPLTSVKFKPPLVNAVVLGYADVVGQLLKCKNISQEQFTKAFEASAYTGKVDIAKIFLKDQRVTQEALFSALKTTSLMDWRNDSKSVKDLLLNDSRYNEEAYNQYVNDQTKNGAGSNKTQSPGTTKSTSDSLQQPPKSYDDVD